MIGKSMFFNEQVMMTRMVEALECIANALEKPEPSYLTIEEIRKLKLANEERTQK